MIPIYGFLERDTIGLLIFAYPNETAMDLIKKVQQSAAVRVSPQRGLNLKFNDKIIDPKMTVEDIGFKPLDHFFVIKAHHV